MAFLYRRDLDILGYEIKVKKIERKRLLSVVAYSELITDNQIIPCMATFFRFTRGVRVDYVFDRDIEKELMDKLLDYLRLHPKLLFQYFIRNTIKVISSICGCIATIRLVCIIFLLEAPISYDVFSMIYSAVLCIVLVCVVRYLMDIV